MRGYGKSVTCAAARVLTLSLLCVLVGCQGSTKDPTSAEGNSGSSTKEQGKAAASSEKMAVARIVIIDQQDCCECTAKRQTDTRANLDSLLARSKQPPVVEVIHMDTEPDLAEAYTQMEPVMVSPGVYFFDGADSLILQLQGEVTVEQFEKVLASGPKQEAGK